MAAAAASAAAAVRAIAMPAETTYSAGLLGAGADGEFSDAKTIEFTGDGKGFDEARIRRVFGGLRGSKTFIDCKVVVGPQKTAFRCHRFVLAARSKAMRAMLFGGWSESAKKIITVRVDDRSRDIVVARNETVVCYHAHLGASLVLASGLFVWRGSCDRSCRMTAQRHGSTSSTTLTLESGVRIAA